MKSKELPEANLLLPMLGSSVFLRFDGMEFKTKLLGVEPQKVTGLKNPPAKRKNAEDKSYTPKCMRIVCEAGALVVALEDCKIVAVHNGVAFVFPGYQLEVRRAD